MSVRRSYSPEVKARAVARYRNGDDIDDIAREAGVPAKASISTWATENGTPPRGRPGTNQKIAK